VRVQNAIAACAAAPFLTHCVFALPGRRRVRAAGDRAHAAVSMQPGGGCRRGWAGRQQQQQQQQRGTRHRGARAGCRSRRSGWRRQQQQSAAASSSSRAQLAQECCSMSAVTYMASHRERKNQKSMRDHDLARRDDLRGLCLGRMSQPMLYILNKQQIGAVAWAAHWSRGHCLQIIFHLLNGNRRDRPARGQQAPC
jgi:hypothetical protein